MTVRSRLILSLAALTTPALLSAQSDAASVASRLKPVVRIEGRADTSFNLLDRMRYFHVPGVSIAVVDDFKLAFAAGFGVTEFGGTTRVDTSTLFLAGSISKPVFASGALRLVDQGRLSLDTDINATLRSWRLPPSRFTETEKVTLRRLLTHTAGLTVWGFPGYRMGTPIPTVQQVLDGATPANTAAVRNDTLPGARWLYSGGGITIAQLMATDVTGEPFPALMKRLVLDPSGMRRSTFENPLPASRDAEAASGHERFDTPVTGRYHVYPEMAAAGLWTTAPELARWALDLTRSFNGIEGGVLSPAMAREMISRQVQQRPPYGIGHVGLVVGVGSEGDSISFSHGGRDEGFVATFVMWPKLGKGIFVLTNGVSGALLNEIMRGFADVYGFGGPPRTTRRVAEADAAAMRSLAGTYRLVSPNQRDTVTLTITPGTGMLRMQDSQLRRTRYLLPSGGDDYFDFDVGSQFTFERAGGAGAEASALVLIQGTNRQVAPRVATPAPAQAPAQAPVLVRGTPIAGTLAARDTARYTINAAANSFVWGVVDQRSVDVVVRVLAPDGTPLARVDGPDHGPEPFRFETKVAGAHQVQVIGFENATGAYTITLDRIEAVATDPRRLADQLFSKYGPDTPGGEVAVFRDGKVIFAKAYGMANLTHRIPFGLDTRTNIGSTSKQFTAFAINLLVEDGKVDLDTDVRTYIPELPDLGAKVTVRHLLTHTSGYREFLNHVILGGRRLDHGDYLDRSELISIVQRQPKLQNAPGAEFNYNNTAFGLAAVIVERVSGMDFPDFMAARVFGPIGMTRTVVRRDPETIVPSMSMGYRPGGKAGYLETRDLFGAMGAGGIYTTVADLQRWVQNLDEPRVGSRATIERMTTSYRLTNGDSTGYGFGLFIDTHRGLKRIQHGGADAAHRSQLFYYPTIHAGITTQSNDAAFDGGIAARLAEAFFAAEMTPATVAATAPFDATKYDARTFDRFAGRYALDAAPAFILTFTRSGDSLFAQATGQQRNRIFPTSDSTFEFRVVAASITFRRAADRTVTGLTLHQGGDQRATRLEGEAPPRWTPTAADLAQFAGRYLSDELETIYTLEMRGDTLVARHIRTDDAPLRAGATADTFNAANAVWTFERDRNGRVIGFYLANGRTRDVRFARMR